MSQKIQIYANVRGEEPMRLLTEFSKDDLPADEAAFTRMLEGVVEFRTGLVQQIEAQMVVVQDGLIIAVEGITTRKLIWCN